MTIDKAIEILVDYHERLPRGFNDDYIDALKLSIEALKAWQHIREGDNQPELWELPSETT